MSWTSPRTWVAGEVVTAQLMNLHVRDNENVLKTALDDNGKIRALTSTYLADLDGSQLTGLNKKLSGQFTSLGNVGSGEDTLMSYTLPAGTLSADGMAVRVTAFGTYAANTNSKNVKGYVGSTVVVGGTANTVNLASHRWVAVVEIIRTGASASLTFGRFTRGNTVEGGEAVTVRQQTQAESWAAPVSISFTGEGVSNNDITQSGMIIELLP
jgi:hypothetical protein